MNRNSLNFQPRYADANSVTDDSWQPENTRRMMIYALISLLIAVAAVCCLIAYLRRVKTVPAPRFSSRRKLLTEAELDLVRALELAVNGRYRIVPKVRLAEVVDPHESLNAAAREQLFERISGVVLDSVLCDARTFEILAAVRLVDADALRDDDDLFLEQALRSANMHLVRVPAKSSYTPAYLATRIESTLSRDFVETLTLMSYPGEFGVSVDRLEIGA